MKKKINKSKNRSIKSRLLKSGFGVVVHSFSLIGIVGTSLLAIWSSLPEANQKEYLKKIYFSFQERPIFRIGSLSSDTCDSKSVVLDLERSVIEYIADKGLSVYSLTNVPEFDRVPSQYTITLKTICDSRDSTQSIRVTLTNTNGAIVSAKSIDIDENALAYFSLFVTSKLPKTEKFHTNLLVKTILETLELPNEIRNKLGLERGFEKYSSSSMLLYRAAQSHYRMGDIESAMMNLENATASEPEFAMGFWAQSTILRENGNTERANELESMANEIDIDHPKIPLPETNFVSYAAKLRKEIRRLKYQDMNNDTNNFDDFFEFEEDEPSFSFGKVMLDTHLGFYVWKFKNSDFSYKIKSSDRGFLSGRESGEKGVMLVIVGGTFNYHTNPNGQQLFEASGLLVEDGIVVSSENREWRSGGYLVMKKNELDIIPRSEFILDSSLSIDSHIIQSKVLVVDPGGKNGIYEDNGIFASRVAICLDFDKNPIFVVSKVPLTLFEFGALLSDRIEIGGLGCERAINLDGGPSLLAYSQDGQGIQATNIDANWKVQNVIVVAKKQ